MSLTPHAFDDIPRIPTVCLCAGGHARVVIDALNHGAEFEVTALLDDDVTKHGSMMHGVPVIGGLVSMAELGSHGIDQFVMGLGGTDRPGGADTREKLFHEAIEAGLGPATVVHPRAIIADDVALGPASVVLAGAILNPKVRLGVSTIVNTGSIVEHEVSIGDHSHVAPGAIVCGGVSIGSHAHIGAGAMVRQGVTIGDRTIVAMGAVVVDDVPAGTTVMGVPAVAA